MFAARRCKSAAYGYNNVDSAYMEADGHVMKAAARVEDAAKPYITPAAPVIEPDSVTIRPAPNWCYLGAQWLGARDERTLIPLL